LDFLAGFVRTLTVYASGLVLSKRPGASTVDAKSVCKAAWSNPWHCTLPLIAVASQSMANARPLSPPRMKNTPVVSEK
jgi:hypothetical protein